MDKRWKELGEIIVNHSLRIKNGEKVMIAMVEIETFPLVLAVYEACIKAGAHPQIQFLSEELTRVLLKQGNQDQIDWVPEIESKGMDWADAYIGLRGAHNLDVCWDVSDEKLASYRRTMGKISTMRWEKTRWCLLRVPNSALAHQAKVDEETITDMFFDACLLDWQALSKEWCRISDFLSGGNKIRIVGKGTDLRFSVEGRSWNVADGRINMPDGEILTSPVESTVDGRIYFEYPGVIGGRLVNDITLTWEKGKLVEAESSTNQNFLRALLETDGGSKNIGEFAFGTNPAIQHFSNDILLDEKMGGTIHIALGRAYPNTGGKNESAIHWDIIKDLRKEGKVYLDDNIIYEKGAFLL